MTTVELKLCFQLRYRSFLYRCQRGNHKAPQQLLLLQICIFCFSLFCRAQEEPNHHVSVALVHLRPGMTSHLWYNRLLTALNTGRYSIYSVHTEWVTGVKGLLRPAAQHQEVSCPCFLGKLRLSCFNPELS